MLHFSKLHHLYFLKWWQLKKGELDCALLLLTGSWFWWKYEIAVLTTLWWVSLVRSKVGQFPERFVGQTSSSSLTHGFWKVVISDIRFELLNLKLFVPDINWYQVTFGFKVYELSIPNLMNNLSSTIAHSATMNRNFVTFNLVWPRWTSVYEK